MLQNGHLNSSLESLRAQSAAVDMAQCVLNSWHGIDSAWLALFQLLRTTLYSLPPSAQNVERNCSKGMITPRKSISATCRHHVLELYLTEASDFD